MRGIKVPRPPEDMLKRYCEKYDSYFHFMTGEWLEPGCKDPDCDYCIDRPAKHKSHPWVYSDGVKRTCGKVKRLSF